MNSEQIYLTDSSVILLQELKNDPLEYNPHLLFFNKNLKLIGAKYFASEKIDSIRNNIIYGIENKERSHRQATYIDDIPKAFSIKLLQIHRGDKGMRIANKIIDSIKYTSSLTSDLVLYVRQDTSNLFTLINFNNNDLNKIPANIWQRKELNYTLSDLLLNFKTNKIIITYFDMDDYKINDEMLISDTMVTKYFLEETWKRILLSCHGCSN